MSADLETVKELHKPVEDTGEFFAKIESHMPDFTVNGIHFQDWKDLTPDQQGRTKELILSEIKSRVPLEDMCHVGSTFEDQIQELRERDFTEEEIADWIENKASKRIPWTFMQGHIEPLFFGALDDDNNVIGGFFLAAAKFLPTTTPTVIHVSCMLTPGTAWLDTQLDKLNFELDLTEFLLAREVNVSGVTYQIMEFHCPLEESTHADDSDDQKLLKSQTEQVIAEREAAGKIIDTKKTDAELGLPYSATRTYHVLTKP